MFQSAPPVKGAILFRVPLRLIMDVSIRAPREGGDSLCLTIRILIPVSIRAPREGGDLQLVKDKMNTNSFNPRPP